MLHTSMLHLPLESSVVHRKGGGKVVVEYIHVLLEHDRQMGLDTCNVLRALHNPSALQPSMPRSMAFRFRRVSKNVHGVELFSGGGGGEGGSGHVIDLLLFRDSSVVPARCGIRSCGLPFVVGGLGIDDVAGMCGFRGCNQNGEGMML